MDITLAVLQALATCPDVDGSVMGRRSCIIFKETNRQEHKPEQGGEKRSDKSLDCSTVDKSVSLFCSCNTLKYFEMSAGRSALGLALQQTDRDTETHCQT